MTDFYALRRYPRSVDWSAFWLWMALIVLGLTELCFAAYGFYHAVSLFLQKVGLGG